MSSNSMKTGSGSRLSIVRPSSKPQKATQTTVDTIIITPEIAKGWLNPPFQRPLRLNQRVIELAEEVKAHEVIPGVITLGVLDGKTYLLDGQHRREAFLISELKEGYLDIRVAHFESMGDMGEEFVKLNSALVRLRPDDMLRGLEASNEHLSRIRKKCPWIGYDQIRRGPSSPVVSMSAVLRCWFGSATEVPKTGVGSASNLVSSLTQDDADELCSFMERAVTAWGKDQEYARLWSSLNLTLVMWLWRRISLAQWSPRVPKVTKELFTKCMMALSASSTYVDWLAGRQMSERDRGPAYSRIKSIFAKRLEEEYGKKAAMPQPSWASNAGRTPNFT